MIHDFLKTLEFEPFYQLIAAKYRGKTARRSGVSYMNHITEGAFILTLLYGYNRELVEAYCVHPLFQSDKALSEILAPKSTNNELSCLSLRALVLTMEYRRVANAYTIRHKVKEAAAIEIGPLSQVHQMLVADKIQNKKDFMEYMFMKHERTSYQRLSMRSLAYFNSWLERLDVDETAYRHVTTQLGKSHSWSSPMNNKTTLFEPPTVAPDAPIEYSKFWELWRAEQFFECHEELEALWKRTRGAERWFFNGLIHGAVAIYQHRRGNANGACRQMLRAQVKLRPFAPRFRGVEIEAFLRFVESEIAASCAQLSDSRRAQWPELRRSIEARMAPDFRTPDFRTPDFETLDLAEFGVSS